MKSVNTLTALRLGLSLEQPRPKKAGTDRYTFQKHRFGGEHSKLGIVLKNFVTIYDMVNSAKSLHVHPVAESIRTPPAVVGYGRFG